MSYLFRLEAAKHWADNIITAIRPHCERVEIAGSIRRGKLVVKDIDIVAIPKTTSQAALFGTTTDLAETDFYAALRKALFEVTAEGTKLIRGIATANQEVRAKLMADIYIATPETWATLLLIRTGSAGHNVWLCSRAKQVGGKLHADGGGLELPGQYDPIAQRTINSRIVRPETEDDIFKAMGLPTPEPRQREIWNGKPAWMGTPTAADLDAIAEERRAREATA